MARVFPTGQPLETPLPLAREFPLLLEDSNAHQVLVLCDEAEPYRPLAAAAFRIFDFGKLNSPQLLRLAGIGLVVTDPQTRGRGYASLLISACEAHARAEGAAAAALWSDLAAFYERLGYLTAGTERSWVLESESLRLARARLSSELAPTPLYSVTREMGPISSSTRFEMMRLYDSLGVGPRREVPTYAAYDEMPRLERWVARDAQGHVQGYALVGKGRDLPNALHEWAGDKKTWPWLLRGILSVDRPHLRVQLPGDHPQLAEIEHWIGQGERVPLAFWKVLHAERLAAWIRSHAALPAGVEVVASNTEKTTQLSVLAHGYTVFESNDPAHLLQLFMGPWIPAEIDGVPEALRSALAGARLPVSPYFWGLDSV